ncbi:MAG: outer membrane protein assembly factor BamB [bacterium]
MRTTEMFYRWTLLVAASLLLSGCSWFSWLPWVDDKDNKEDPAEPAKLVKFDAEIKLERLWKTSVGDGLGKKYLKLPPAIVADLIIAADGYGHVQANDRFTGKRVWQAEVGQVGGSLLSVLNFIDRRDPSFVSGGVGAGAGKVYLGTTGGYVIALDVADGTELWRTDLGSEVVAPAAADGSLVFAQTIDGRLVAMRADSGEIQWTFDNQLPILTLRGTSMPVIAEDIVYAGFANGKLIALRAENGEPIWEHRVMLPEGRSELDRMVDVDTTPLVNGPAVYVGAFQGRVKALSRRDGRALWELEVSTFQNLSEGYGQIYVVDDEDVVAAYDQQTGEQVWVNEDFKLRGLTAPLAFSNYVVFGDAEGYLHVIAQRDGRHLGRRKLDGDGIRSELVLGESTLYVLGNSGSLHALEIELR